MHANSRVRVGVLRHATTTAPATRKMAPVPATQTSLTDSGVLLRSVGTAASDLVGATARCCASPRQSSSANSTQCECVTGYAGPSCALPCPGVQENQLCSGHGTCSSGYGGNGACSCDANYYGANCSVFCTVSKCRKASGLTHVMCDSSNGTCVCYRGADGQYSGKECDDCATFYWGLQCQLLCLCNYHGSCDRYTGECECFADDDNGYWAGTACTKCASGYIGSQCRSKNIQLSSNTGRSSAIDGVGAGRLPACVH